MMDIGAAVSGERLAPLISYLRLNVFTALTHRLLSTLSPCSLVWYFALHTSTRWQDDHAGSTA